MCASNFHSCVTSYEIDQISESSDHSNAYLADSLIEYHYGIAPIENESTVQTHRKEITSQSSTQMEMSEIIFFMNEQCNLSKSSQC